MTPFQRTTAQMVVVGYALGSKAKVKRCEDEGMAATLKNMKEGELDDIYVGEEEINELEKATR